VNLRKDHSKLVDDPRSLGMLGDMSAINYHFCGNPVSKLHCLGTLQLAVLCVSALRRTGHVVFGSFVVVWLRCVDACSLKLRSVTCGERVWGNLLAAGPALSHIYMWRTCVGVVTSRSRPFTCCWVCVRVVAVVGVLCRVVISMLVCECVSFPNRKGKVDALVAKYHVK